MHGAGWNQEMVVLPRRPLSHISLGRKRSLGRLCASQIARNRGAIDTLVETEIDCGIFLSREHVVAFVLSVVHAKRLLDVFSQRMHLKTEVASAYRIEEVESNGEFVAEPA